MLSFDSARDYLKVFAGDSDLAVVSVSMAAAALDRTRSGVLLMLKAGKLDEIAIAGTRCVRAQSLVEIEHDFMDSVTQARKRLAQIAAKRSLTTYEPIMSLVGLRNVAPDRKRIGEILGRASEVSYDEHGFLISTLVCRSVNGKPAMPGDGYWPLAEGLLERRIRKEDRRVVFKEQLRKVYKHYEK